MFPHSVGHSLIVRLELFQCTKLQKAEMIPFRWGFKMSASKQGEKKKDCISAINTKHFMDKENQKVQLNKVYHSRFNNCSKVLIRCKPAIFESVIQISPNLFVLIF